MKGYPDAGQNPVGVVRDTDDHMVELAKSNVARRAQAACRTCARASHRAWNQRRKEAA